MRYRFSYQAWRKEMRVPLRTAHGPWTAREGIFLRLEADGGQVTFGEVAPLPWFGTETMAEAEEVLRKLGSDLGAEALELVPPRCGCVRFALAAALAQNKARGGSVPGGARLPVAALLPAGRAALDVLPRQLEAGFLAFKWKVGVDRPEEELPLLDDLVAMLPGYAKLRLDANGAWTVRDASRWLGRCAERPVEFVEQPLMDADALLGLAQDFPVKLALDEAVTGLAAAREWQQRGWPGIFVVKPALAGPLADLVAWAKQTKPDLVLSSAIETALARAQILRAAFAENLTTRALGFGIGGVFGDRTWDGPAAGPLLDASWCDGVNAEELWNAAN